MINSQLSKLKSIKGFKMANLNLNINSLLKSIDKLRACSYDPAYRDVSLTETNISVRSYGIFRPACRDEIQCSSTG